MELNKELFSNEIFLLNMLKLRWINKYNNRNKIKFFSGYIALD